MAHREMPAAKPPPLKVDAEGIVRVGGTRVTLDVDNDILRGTVRRFAELDVVRVQDVGLMEAPDPVLLEWDAAQERIVLIDDVSTMPAHAHDRTRAGLRMAGVCIVPRSLPMGQAIEELLQIAQCGTREDRENQVRYLPL